MWVCKIILLFILIFFGCNNKKNEIKIDEKNVLDIFFRNQKLFISEKKEYRVKKFKSIENYKKKVCNNNPFCVKILDNIYPNLKDFWVIFPKDELSKNIFTTKNKFCNYKGGILSKDGKKILYCDETPIFDKETFLKKEECTKVQTIIKDRFDNEYDYFKNGCNHLIYEDNLLKKDYDLCLKFLPLTKKYKIIPLTYPFYRIMINCKKEDRTTNSKYFLYYDQNYKMKNFIRIHNYITL